jgi:hypothetical protein
MLSVWLGILFVELAIRTVGPEMRYCEIGKEMSLMYFRLAVVCLFEARVPEFDMQPTPHPPDSVHCTLNTASNSDGQFLR